MASTDLSGRSHRVWADSPDLKWIAGVLVLGAITFNAILCFIHTNVVSISNTYVIGSEIILILLSILASYRSINRIYVLLMIQLVLFTLTLALIRYNFSPNDGLDIKISRDVLIPIVFFILGKSISDVKAADYIVYIAAALMLFFALFEYLFLETYLKFFSVAQYYVARGTLDAYDPGLQWAKGLMLSGMRPSEQGRGLLSILGEHRVSGLFLEPISLGNFGCMVVMWAVVRSRMERQFRICSIAAGLAFILLSDTRFDAYFLFLGMVILFATPRITTPGVIVMPFIIMFGLYFAAASVDHVGGVLILDGLSMRDRLLYSGRVLHDFDIYNWLGAKASRIQTFDAGYAYVISNAGIIGFAIFWCLFMSLKGYSRHFYAFRNASAAYFAALFCISASQLTIKTGSLLWFLLGALSVARDKESMVFSNRTQK